MAPNTWINGIIMSVVISKNVLIFATGYKFRVSVSRGYHKKSQDGLLIFDDCVTVFYNNAITV